MCQCLPMALMTWETPALSIITAYHDQTVCTRIAQHQARLRATSTRHSHQTCQILWISATKVELRTSKTQAKFCTVTSLHRMASLCIGFQQQLKERLIPSPAVSRLPFVQLQAGPRSLRLQQPLASVKVCQPSRHQVKQLEQTCRSILRQFQWTLLQLSRVRITVTCKFKHLWVALVLKVKPWVKFHPYLYRDSSNWNVAKESTIFWQFLELKRSHFTICSNLTTSRSVFSEVSICAHISGSLW